MREPAPTVLAAPATTGRGIAADVCVPAWGAFEAVDAGVES